MTTIEPAQQPTRQPSRPELLNILCILTFIGSGLSAVANFIIYLTIDKFSAYYENGDLDFFTGNMDINPLELLTDVNPTFFVLQAIVFSLSFYGAFLMWNLKKKGFHFYSIAQLILIIISQIYLPRLPFPFLELLITVAFITLYARNLKFMK